LVSEPAGACDAHHGKDIPPSSTEIGTADKAVLQRKVLLWGLKPVEASLSEISDITIDTAVDRASGVEVCHTMLIMRGGTGWSFPAGDKTEAETNAAAMRNFLAITA
jgi:hypothetical protein